MTFAQDTLRCFFSLRSASVLQWRLLNEGWLAIDFARPEFTASRRSIKRITLPMKALWPIG